MFSFAGLIDVFLRVLKTVADYFHEIAGRYFVQLILPLKGMNLHYGCIYLTLQDSSLFFL